MWVFVGRVQVVFVTHIYTHTQCDSCLCHKNANKIYIRTRIKMKHFSQFYTQSVYNKILWIRFSCSSIILYQSLGCLNNFFGVWNPSVIYFFNVIPALNGIWTNLLTYVIQPSLILLKNSIWFQSRHQSTSPSEVYHNKHKIHLNSYR